MANLFPYKFFADLPAVVHDAGAQGTYLLDLPSVTRGKLNLEKARAWANTRLAVRGLHIHRDRLGAGKWGSVYPMLDAKTSQQKGVVKLTGDISEAAMAQRILDLPERPAALPHIYAVYKLPNHVWLIWREDLESIYGAISNRGVEAIERGWGKRDIAARLPHQEATRILQFYRDLDRVGINLPHTIDGEFEQGRWEFFDIHGANLRARGTTIVLADLGASTGEATVIPVAMNPRY